MFIPFALIVIVLEVGLGKIFIIDDLLFIIGMPTSKLQS